MSLSGDRPDAPVPCSGDGRNRGNMVMIAAFDATAASDCLSHEILLEKLQKGRGLEGSALQLVDAFLADREQRVRMSCGKVSGWISTGERRKAKCGHPCCGRKPLQTSSRTSTATSSVWLCVWSADEHHWRRSRRWRRAIQRVHPGEQHQALARKDS